jgi:5-methylcytosine-specific restriction protein B
MGSTSTDADVIDDGQSLDSLAASLFLDVQFLERIKLLLEEKRQVIFFGPPGTGKTYVAHKFAERVAGSNTRVKII